MLSKELDATGVLFFNVEPGLIGTERMAADMAEFGIENVGAPADVVAAVIVWLVTDPEAAEWNGRNIEAQFFCHRARPAPRLGRADPQRGSDPLRHVRQGARRPRDGPCAPGSVRPAKGGRRSGPLKAGGGPAPLGLSAPVGLSAPGGPGGRPARALRPATVGRAAGGTVGAPGRTPAELTRINPSPPQRALGCWPGHPTADANRWMEHRTESLFRGDLELPRYAGLLRHAGRHLIEATLAPLALFYLFLALVGIWGALIAALVWSYGAIARRVITGARLPGLLLLGALGITVRTAIAFATGSVFIYFLQPTLLTVGIAGAFLVSASIGHPLAQRLAADFCPSPTTSWPTRACGGSSGSSPCCGRSCSCRTRRSPSPSW